MGQHQQHYSALELHQHAISTLQKALFIDPDDVPATVHLARLYLTPPTDEDASYPAAVNSSPNPDGTGKEEHVGPHPSQSSKLSQSNVDLACGLLTQSSRGRGWDVPEVWYYLATAYRLQGRFEKETHALEKALRLAEGRGVREIRAAIGLCI